MRIEEYLKIHPVTDEEIIKQRRFENKRYKLSLEGCRTLYFINPKRKGLNKYYFFNFNLKKTK